MEIINVLLINIIIMFFPLVINLFYLAHSKNIEKEYNATLLDFSLLSAIYLFYTHFKIENTIQFIVFLNIPLIIAFIKNRKFVSFIISIFIIFIHYLNTDMSLVLLIIEYLIYYLIFIMNNTNKKRVNVILSYVLSIKCLVTLVNLFLFEELTLMKSVTEILVSVV